MKKDNHIETDFHLQLLSDTLKLVVKAENDMVQQMRKNVRTCRDECRRLIRGLEHCEL